MSWDLRNKVVVITGAADGIGLGIADKYLESGSKAVIILDIVEKEGLDSEKNLCTKYGVNKAVFIKCDVVSDLDVVSKKIIDTYKTVDVLVNCAGILNEQCIEKTIDINVVVLINWSLKFWEHMRTDKGGKGRTIINLSSVYGCKISQHVPVYQASKFAVVGFTKSLGHTHNFNRAGVRVITICPGFTETKLIVDLKAWDDSCLTKDFLKFANEQLWQKVDAVGKAAVEVFENANSGTAWIITGGKPIFEV